MILFSVVYHTQVVESCAPHVPQADAERYTALLHRALLAFIADGAADATVASVLDAW